MKVLFLFLTFFISINSIAQSKKEQIDMLNVRVDSLNSKYVKDTTLLSNTVREVNKENVDLSEQLEKSKEQLKKKSATITDKSNTIKSLNVKNMELMSDSKKLYQNIRELESEIKSLKFQPTERNSIFYLVKSVSVNEWEPEKSIVDIGVFLNGEVFIFDADVKGMPNDCDGEAIEHVNNREFTGYSCDTSLGVHKGGNSQYIYTMYVFENQRLAIKREVGDPNEFITLWQIFEDTSSGRFTAILKCKGKISNSWGEPDIPVELVCLTGDCTYLGYLQGEVDKIRDGMLEYDE